MTVDQTLKDILRNLLSDTTDLEGAAVISTDGLIVVSMLPSGSDEDRLSAMAESPTFSW